MNWVIYFLGVIIFLLISAKEILLNEVEIISTDKKESKRKIYTITIGSFFAWLGLSWLSWLIVIGYILKTIEKNADKVILTIGKDKNV